MPNSSEIHVSLFFLLLVPVPSLLVVLRDRLGRARLDPRVEVGFGWEAGGVGSGELGSMSVGNEKFPIQLSVTAT